MAAAESQTLLFAEALESHAETEDGQPLSSVARVETLKWLLGDDTWSEVLLVRLLGCPLRSRPRQRRRTLCVESMREILPDSSGASWATLAGSMYACTGNAQNVGKAQNVISGALPSGDGS
jgi:hypothetical protein